MEGVTCIHSTTRVSTESGQMSAKRKYCLVPTARKNQRLECPWRNRIGSDKCLWVTARHSRRVCETLQVKRNLARYGRCHLYSSNHTRGYWERPNVCRKYVLFSTHRSKEPGKVAMGCNPTILPCMQISASQTQFTNDVWLLAIWDEGKSCCI